MWYPLECLLEKTDVKITQKWWMKWLIWLVLVLRNLNFIICFLFLFFIWSSKNFSFPIICESGSVFQIIISSSAWEMCESTLRFGIENRNARRFWFVACIIDDDRRLILEIYFHLNTNTHENKQMQNNSLHCLNWTTSKSPCSSHDSRSGIICCTGKKRGNNNSVALIFLSLTTYCTWDRMGGPQCWTYYCIARSYRSFPSRTAWASSTAGVG